MVRLVPLKMHPDMTQQGRVRQFVTSQDLAPESYLLEQKGTEGRGSGTWRFPPHHESDELLKVNQALLHLSFYYFSFKNFKIFYFF